MLVNVRCKKHHCDLHGFCSFIIPSGTVKVKICYYLLFAIEKKIPIIISRYQFLLQVNIKTCDQAVGRRLYEVIDNCSVLFLAFPKLYRIGLCRIAVT